jgi:hypothetical protein
LADVDNGRIRRVHNDKEGGSDEEQEGRNDEEEEGREMARRRGAGNRTVKSPVDVETRVGYRDKRDGV